MWVHPGRCGAALALLLVSDAAAGGATRYRMRSAREVWAELRAASRETSRRQAGSSSAAPPASQLLRDRHRRSRQLFELRKQRRGERQGATTRRWKELRDQRRRLGAQPGPSPAPLPTELPPLPPDTLRSLHPARPLTPSRIRWGLRGGR